MGTSIQYHQKWIQIRVPHHASTAHNLWLMGNPTFSGAVSSVSSFSVAAVLAHAYPYLSKTCQIGVPAFRAIVTILDQACTYPTHAILAVNPFH